MTREASIEGVGVGVGEGGAGAPAVLLRARGEIIPIFVDPGQAQSIENARQDVPAPRPMTHDLLVGVMDDLDGRLDRVRIDDLEDGTFFAKLDLTVEQRGEPTDIVRDARPSDGIALAARVGCPITVADAVIDEAGVDPDELERGPPETGTAGSSGRGLGREPGASGQGEPDVDADAGVEIDIGEPGDPEEADDDEGDPESEGDGGGGADDPDADPDGPDPESDDDPGSRSP